MKGIYTLLLLCLAMLCSISTIHAQQQAERLKAVAFYDFFNSPYLLPYDSIEYFYSGIRSTDTIWQVEQEADSSLTWLYHGANGYISSAKQVSQYDGSNRITGDTVWTWDSAGATYFYNQNTTYSYDSSGHPTIRLTQHYDTTAQAWGAESEQHRIYDSAGDYIIQYSLQWVNNQWDTVGLLNEHYDHNNHVTDGADYFYPVGTGIGNNHVGIDSFSYDNLGRFDTTWNAYYLIDSSTIHTTTMSIYSYDSLGDLSTVSEYSHDSTGWVLSNREVWVYDTHHNPVQHTIQYIDTPGIWINNYRYISTYDNYNMRTLYEYDRWDTAAGGAWVPSEHYHFYYELYTLPGGIADIAPAGDLRLYPVPAAGMLSLDLTWTEAQPATAAIYDMSGRKYSEWALPATTSYHGYIPASMLAAGTYVLRVTGSSGSIGRTFNVMK